MSIKKYEDIDRKKVRQGDLSYMREIAIFLHKDQKYNNLPYITHIDEVCNILKEYGYADTKYQIVAIFHDALEDAGVGGGHLLSTLFPDEITHAIASISNNLRDRYELTELGSIVKIADRIANLRTTVNNKSTHYINRYCRGIKWFIDEHKKTITPMWKELDSLYDELNEEYNKITS